MEKEISLESIMAKLEEIERLLANSQHQPSVQSVGVPSTFLPGGKDWFLMASEEERRAFNRKRGQASRRTKK